MASAGDSESKGSSMEPESKVGGGEEAMEGVEDSNRKEAINDSTSSTTPGTAPVAPAPSASGPSAPPTSESSDRSFPAISHSPPSSPSTTPYVDPHRIDRCAVPEHKGTDATCGVTWPAIEEGTLEKSLLYRGREDMGGGNTLEFRVITNNGNEYFSRWLIAAKSIFATQLPKMPAEYIVRLVFDRRHRTLVALRGSTVVGGICFRPYFPQRFAEIAFCAITSTEQVKGYGTRLMNHLKDAVTPDGIEAFLTYADNYAIGYFKKQGFTKGVSMPHSRWKGYIKDYDGGTLMECIMHPRVRYTKSLDMMKRQRELVIELIKARAGEASKARPGLEFSGEDSALPAGVKTELDIPGAREAGWHPEALKAAKERNHSHDDLYTQLLKLTREVEQHAEAWPFLQPVKADEVPGYHTVIKQPMDISTIMANVKSFKYKSITEWLTHLNLMFSNCREFNPATSQFVSCAKKLEMFICTRVRKMTDSRSRKA